MRSSSALRLERGQTAANSPASSVASSARSTSMMPAAALDAWFILEKSAYVATCAHSGGKVDFTQVSHTTGVNSARRERRRRGLRHAALHVLKPTAREPPHLPNQQQDKIGTQAPLGGAAHTHLFPRARPTAA